MLSLHPEFRKRPVDGFSAGLVDDNNVYEWEITIFGYLTIISSFFPYLRSTLYISIHKYLTLTLLHFNGLVWSDFWSIALTVHLTPCSKLSALALLSSLAPFHSYLSPVFSTILIAWWTWKWWWLSESKNDVSTWISTLTTQTPIHDSDVASKQFVLPTHHFTWCIFWLIGSPFYSSSHSNHLQQFTVTERFVSLSFTLLVTMSTVTKTQVKDGFRYMASNQLYVPALTLPLTLLQPRHWSSFSSLPLARLRHFPLGIW